VAVWEVLSQKLNISRALKIFEILKR